MLFHHDRCHRSPNHTKDNAKVPDLVKKAMPRIVEQCSHKEMSSGFSLFFQTIVKLRRLSHCTRERRVSTPASVY